MQHVDEGTLQAWLDGEAVDPAIRRHVDACAECAGRVVELRALGERTAEILRRGATPAPAPDFASVQERAAHQRRSTPPRRRWRAPAWAASVVLAVGVGWMARQGLNQGPLVPPPAADAAAGVGASEVGREAARGVESARESEPESEAAPAIDAQAAAEASPTLGSAAAPARNEEASMADAEPGRLTAPVPAGPAENLPAPPGSVEQASPAAARITAAATDGMLRGRVTDGNGEGLAGAQVYLPGTALGALSQSDGSFLIVLGDADVPDSAVIQVELIGYAAETLALGPAREADAPLDIRLSQQALALDEVVVTGTAADVREREDPVGAVSSVPGVETLDPSALDWSAASREEAEGLLGFRLRVLDDVDPDGVGVGSGPEPVAARLTVPVGSDGGLITLYQSRRVMGLGEEDAAEGLSAATRQIGDVQVLAVGPVDPDVLEEVLARLR